MNKHSESIIADPPLEEKRILTDDSPKGREAVATHDIQRKAQKVNKMKMKTVYKITKGSLNISRTNWNKFYSSSKSLSKTCKV